MSLLKTETHDLTPRQYMARHMLERASAALVYLGIVSTFVGDRQSVSGTVVK